MTKDVFAGLRAKYGKPTKGQKVQRQQEETRSIEENIDDILSGSPQADNVAQVQQISANHRRNLLARKAQDDAVDQMLLETLGPKEAPLAERKAAEKAKAIAEHREAEGNDFMQGLIDILDGAGDQYGMDLQQRLRDTLGEDSDRVG